MSLSTSGWDVVVAGAGSGGLGAALAAARGGCRTLLIEAAPGVGGNMVYGGVHAWEPGIGGTGLPAEIHHRARAVADGVGAVSCAHVYRPDEPYGLWRQDPRVTYADTLRRTGLPPQGWHAVVFEPSVYQAVVTEMLAAEGVEVWPDCRVVGCEARDGTVTAATVERAGRRCHVAAYVFIDSTASVQLCRLAGCATWLGDDPRERFGEPSAPVQATGRLNAVSLIYRVRSTGRPVVAPLPADVPPDLWRRAAHIVESPNGARTVNVLPTMEGDEFVRLGADAACRECRRRIDAHWHWLQTEHAYADWERFWVAPALGVREGPRVQGEWVLTEHDLDAGLGGQGHADIIALADHAKDTHGVGGGCRELAGPYGVPFRCLVPRGWRNLLAACRGASFSHIAASSCRLSRTMMQLGQAAGTAAALARDLHCSVSEVPAAALRQRLLEQGVQLAWDGWHTPVPGALTACGSAPPA